MNLLSLMFLASTLVGLFALPLRRDIYVYIGILGLVGAGLMRCLAVKSSMLMQLATMLESIGLASILAITLKRLMLRRPIFGERGAALLISTALLLLIVLGIHNVIRFSEISASGAKDLVYLVNPWGLFEFLTVFICFFLLKGGPYKPLGAMKWVVASLSIAFIALDLAVYLGLMPGNTEKFLEGTGGLGPANQSTNETAALAVALLIWHVRFFFSSRAGFFHALIAAALLSVIAISKSRSGLLCAGLVILIFILRSKGTGKLSLITRPILLVAAILGASFAFQIIQERNSAESMLDRRYDNLQLSSGVSGSGRALIWFEYISAYSEVVSKNSFSAIFGVGQFGLWDLYEHTMLGRLGYAAGTQAFLPVHSDLLALLFSGGSVSLIFIFAGTAWTIAQRQALLKSPTRLSALVILILLPIIDMLQYQAGVYGLLFAALFYHTDLPFRVDS